MSNKPATLTLRYREPYDFAGVLEFLGRRAIPEVEAVDAGRYKRVVGPGWIEVAAAPRAPALELRMHGIPAGERAAVAARARAVFDLDADPALVNRALRRGALLRNSVRRRPGLRVAGSWDGFDLAVRAVLGQQISVAAARTLAARLVRRYGRPLAAAPHAITHAFPEPAVLAEAGYEGIGTTRNVAETLRTVARAVCEGRLSFDPALPLEEFVARFTALRGIGPWTAHYVAMRALRHADAFPASDLVLCQVAGAPGPALKPKALAELAEAWRPYRSYAVMHLWRMAGDPPRAAAAAVAR